MCNHARIDHEPETIYTRVSAEWAAPRPMDNRFNPVELYSKARAWIVREEEGRRGLDAGTWDVLGVKRALLG